MKLLFDQNLSHRLLTELGDLFPGSLHVRILGLAEADDLQIWNYAMSHNLVIVTQSRHCHTRLRLCGLEQTPGCATKNYLVAVW